MAKYSRTVGPDKNFMPSGRVVKYGGLYLGYVKDNRDAQRMGRLRVWVPEFGSLPDDEGGWTTVSYASPFAGATNPNLLGNNTQIEQDTQTSYGWWAVPPDRENQVLIMFVNGDPTRGVWIGSLYQQFMNHMVPGVPAAGNFQHDKNLPVAEYNKKTSENVRNDITRPEISSHSESIASQGLIDDSVRGTTDSGARRETPSQVYGLLTPGPIDPDSSDDTRGRKRLGGGQFYFDDGDGREHMRIRTRNGAQLLIDDSNGLIYAINKDGTSWMQMDAEGNFDVFAAKSVSIRSQEDINYRADRDINLEAGRDINLKARRDYLNSADGSIGGEGAGGGGNITMQALNDMVTTVENNLFSTVTKGDVDISIAAGSRRVTIAGSDEIGVSGAVTLQSGGKYDINIGSTFGVASSNLDISTSGSIQGAGNIVADGNVYGSNVFSSSAALNDLNNHTHKITSGSSAGTTAPFSSGGGNSSANGPATEATAATAAVPIETVEKTNVLSTFADENNFGRNTETVLTVVGRFLTFEPCPEHNNKGNNSDT